MIPLISASINTATVNVPHGDLGYFYESLFWAFMIFLGTCTDTVLYFWDLKLGGILNKVDSG